MTMFQEQQNKENSRNANAQNLGWTGATCESTCTKQQQTQQQQPNHQQQKHNNQQVEQSR